jgi:integrase
VPGPGRGATIAMRSFLRYLRLRGDVVIDLAAAVPTVPNWSMTAIPRAIAPDHLRAVLDSCRRDTVVGRRDYAILLLLARLGLRAGEIVSLTPWQRRLGPWMPHGARLQGRSALGTAVARRRRQRHRGVPSARPTAQRLPPAVSARKCTCRRPGFTDQHQLHRRRRHRAGRGCTLRTMAPISSAMRWPARCCAMAPA